jgi:hypothetical protein
MKKKIIAGVNSKPESKKDDTNQFLVNELMNSLGRELALIERFIKVQQRG